MRTDEDKSSVVVEDYIALVGYRRGMIKEELKCCRKVEEEDWGLKVSRLL